MDFQEIQHKHNAKLLLRLEITSWMTNLMTNYSIYYLNDKATSKYIYKLVDGSIPRVNNWQWFAERYEVEIWLYRTNREENGKCIDLNCLPPDIWTIYMTTDELKTRALGLGSKPLYKYIHHDIASMSLLTLFRIWLALGYTICLKNVPTYNIEPAHDLWLRP